MTKKAYDRTPGGASGRKYTPDPDRGSRYFFSSAPTDGTAVAEKVLRQTPKHPPGRYVPGVCRNCGCVDRRACNGGCSWVDHAHTKCSGCFNAAGDRKQLELFSPGGRER